MRDALSLADQCISFYLGQTLTYEKVLEVLGAVDTEVFSRLLRRVLENDVAALFAQVEDLIMQGRDLTQLVNDFTWYLRNLMLLKARGDGRQPGYVGGKLACSEGRGGHDPGRYPDALYRIFSELANQMRYAVNKRVLLEVALIKLCRPQMERDELSMENGVRRLEKMLEEGTVAVVSAARRFPSDSRQNDGAGRDKRAFFWRGGEPASLYESGAGGSAAD